MSRGCKVRFRLGPQLCSPPASHTADDGLATLRFTVGISTNGGSLLPGSPAITKAGLPPASSTQHANGLPSHLNPRARRSFASGHTMGAILPRMTIENGATKRPQNANIPPSIRRSSFGTLRVLSRRLTHVSAKHPRTVLVDGLEQDQAVERSRSAQASPGNLSAIRGKIDSPV